MSEEKETNSPESPGPILKAKRVGSDLTIEQITAETKISASVIRAMESDDFAQLPAPAFTKGFYSLYAETLGLDVEHIVDLYQTLHGGKSTKKKKETVPSDVGALTKRPFVPIFSVIGFTLLLLFLIFGTLSWYFSWNPADFLSQQLRGVETEYHDTEGKDLGMQPPPSLSSTDTSDIKLTIDTGSTIAFPSAKNSQGIEISELSHNTPHLPLTPISPENIVGKSAPQIVLQ